MMAGAVSLAKSAIPHKRNRPHSRGDKTAAVAFSCRQATGPRSRWDVAKDLAALESQVEGIERALRKPRLSDADKRRMEGERYWALEDALIAWRLGAAHLVTWAVEKLQQAEGVSRPLSEADSEDQRRYLWWLLTRMNEPLPIAWRDKGWVPVIVPGQVYAELLKTFRGTGKFIPLQKRSEDLRPRELAR